MRNSDNSIRLRAQARCQLKGIELSFRKGLRRAQRHPTPEVACGQRRAFLSDHPTCAARRVQAAVHEAGHLFLFEAVGLIMRTHGQHSRMTASGRAGWSGLAYAVNSRDYALRPQDYSHDDFFGDARAGRLRRAVGRRAAREWRCSEQHRRTG